MDADIDRQAFQLAQRFLINLAVPGLDQALLEKYMRLPELQPRPETAITSY